MDGKLGDEVALVAWWGIFGTDEDDLILLRKSEYRQKTEGDTYKGLVMAKSRAVDTYARLLSMIDDPHPNVICQVFFALGERGRRTAINPIKQRMLELDHWYAQWYGYGALRKLGWRQTRSN